MGLCIRQEYSGIFSPILHPWGMKHTGNQKVVTALLSESLYKGSYLPHIRLVLPYLIEIPSMPLQSKIGACSVSLSGLPISNRETTAQRNFAFTWYNQFPDFKSGYYRRGLSSNFRVGANQIPLCSSQKRKVRVLCPSGFKSAPGKFRVLAGRLCVLVTDISGERLIREWEGSRRLLQSHYNKRVFGSWILLPNVLY